MIWGTDLEGWIVVKWMCVRGRVVGIWSCDHYSAWEHWKWLFFNLVPAAVSSELKVRRTEVRHTAGSV